MYLYKIIAELLLFAGISGLVTGNDIDLDELKSKLPAGVALPSGLLNSTSIDDIKNILQEKCMKNTGSEDTFPKIQDGATELVECIQDIINVTSIQAEIEIATPIGELDTVFHKYCLKRPDVLKCVENFNLKVKLCLDEEEKKSSDTLMKIITSMLNFVCYKGGDQIALFIAEKGPECLKEKQDAITGCLNKTVQPYVAQGIPSVEDLPKLTIGPKQCTDMQNLKTCVVDALQGCEEITPANIVESMFKFIRNETSCSDPEKNSQTQIWGQFNVFLMAILSLVLCRFLSW